MKRKVEEKVENIDVKELAGFCVDNFSTHFKKEIEISNYILEQIRNGRR
jgi:hypothetical protein